MTHWTISAERRGSRCASVILLASCALCSAALAGPLEPDDDHREAAKAVVAVLSRDHLSRRPLDDEISRRCLKAFLKTLDPRKLYFLRSDVDDFMRHKNDLDDQLRSGDVSLAFAVFNTLLARIDQRTKLAEEMPAMRHDFTADERMAIDFDRVPYARNENQAREKWRKQVKYDLLLLKSCGIGHRAAAARLRSRYRRIAERTHRTGAEELMEIYLTALCKAFDPHSAYLSPGTLSRFQISMVRIPKGVGLALDSEDGYVVVRKIVVGYSAHKDGRLQLRDKIIGVGQGSRGELADVVAMPLADVVKLTRGERGTVVRLQVVAFDDSRPRIIDLTRAEIERKDREVRSRIVAISLREM